MERKQALEVLKNIEKELENEFKIIENLKLINTFFILFFKNI